MADVATRDRAERLDTQTVAATAAVEPRGERNQITVRCILLGALLCAIGGVASPYNNNIIYGSYLTTDHTAVGAVAVLFLLVMVGNTAARWLERRLGGKALAAGVVLTAAGGAIVLSAANLLPRPHAESSGVMVLAQVIVTLAAAGWGVLALLVLSRLVERLWARGPWLSLSRAELLMVFVMLLMGSAVATMGLANHIVPTLPAGEYYASPSNGWDETLLPHLPAWARVTDPNAVTAFYEGLQRQPGFVEPRADYSSLPMVQGLYEVRTNLRQIPWGAWAGPLAAWAVFLVPLYLFMISSMVIVRGQWMDREVLSYPLARLPGEMAQLEGPPQEAHLLGPLFRNRTMWLGFSVPVAWVCLRGLHFYFPTLPEIPHQWQTQFMSNQVTLLFVPSFVVIGFTYLINTRVAFSIWGLTLVALFVSGWMAMRGYKSPEYLGVYGTADKPFMYHLGMGALVTMALYTLWSARQYFGQVLRKAVTGRGLDDAEEIIRYRTAVILCALSAAVMLGWLMAIGMSWAVALFFWAVTVLIFYGVTRIVAEAGLGACVAPGIAPIVTTSKLGAAGLGDGTLAALGAQYPYCADVRTFPMVAAAHALKLTDDVRGNRGRIFWGMLIALAVAAGTGIATMIYLAYVYQGTSLEQWVFRDAPQLGLKYAARMIQDRPGPNVQGWVHTLLGAGLMIGLVAASRRFLWWPLHPVGLAVMGIWIMGHIWFSVFVAWLVKVLILKYGGQRAYVRSIPFFLGLILGQCVVALMWILIDYTTGAMRNTLCAI